jgi:hypothetical protein
MDLLGGSYVLLFRIFGGAEECDENPQYRATTAAEIRTMYCQNKGA